MLISRSASEFSAGFDVMVKGLESSLEAVMENAGELPLVGDQLADGVEPLLQTLDDLGAATEAGFALIYDECMVKANPVDCFEIGLSEIFGPAGLDLLLDGPDAGNTVGRSDIFRSSGVDDGDLLGHTRWVGW